jgi:hypothetical protein
MPSACQIRRGLSSAIWLTSSFTVHIRFRPTASRHVVLSTPQFCIIRSARSSGLFGQSGAPPRDLRCPPSKNRGHRSLLFIVFVLRALAAVLPGFATILRSKRQRCHRRIQEFLPNPNPHPYPLSPIIFLPTPQCPSPLLAVHPRRTRSIGSYARLECFRSDLRLRMDAAPCCAVGDQVSSSLPYRAFLLVPSDPFLS